MFSTALFPLVFAAHALAHGVVTTPTPRKIGSAVKSACGTAVYNELKSDEYGPIENSVAKEDSTYNADECHLYFCRGYEYADNTDNIRAYAAGTEVAFHVDLEAHHTGLANVSVVDVAARTVIGSPLFNWPVYANESLPPAEWPANETDFTVTVPDLGTKCATAGACAIQWWWYAYSNDQTYESCVDFTQ
ncbi:hypothetical protein PLICRDRAFT_171527 [Plicaturopsis crispa FD-325 SS-3]|nr:hypothetical protein PLICRDRAFT_171527 [Plicaturopsis crispa FD-325 SS-3]